MIHSTPFFQAQYYSLRKILPSTLTFSISTLLVTFSMQYNNIITFQVRNKRKLQHPDLKTNLLSRFL